MFSADRRRFLRAAGTTVAASVTAQTVPAAIVRALATPAHRATGTIADVGHVVILMQENRSFDHYFGSLRGVRGFADPRVLTLANGAPVWQQPNAKVHTPKYNARGVADDAPYILPFHLDTAASGDHQDGTDHGWSSGHQAWNLGRYDQWVEQKQDALTMAYLRREDVSFHYALADAFTICDGYFASAHADTSINRIYLWTGTADPRNAHGRKANGPGLEERAKVNGYTWTTYPERLEAQGVSWKVYQGGTGDPGTPTDNYTDNSLEFFANYQIAEGANPQGPLVRKGASTHTLEELRDDVIHGRLPQVSWIVAPFRYSEHPTASPTDGAFYIQRVIEALTANTEVWSKTVLFLNYDENDGLFDHVVPPAPPLVSEQGNAGMVSADLIDALGDEILDLDAHPHEMNPLVPGADPGGQQTIGLGVRVPMLVISPWTKGGWVCSQTFDHTSVLQFLEARFGVHEPNISAWRRAVCGDLTAAFDFASKPEPAMPELHVPGSPVGRAPVSVPVQQVMPGQEPGTRPARPLAYAWTIKHRLDIEASRSWIEFSNAGRLGAAFYVYDGCAAEAAPRRYTISAGDTLSDYWPCLSSGGAYDHRIHGTNGYFCHFRGGSNDLLEVLCTQDVSGMDVQMTLTNTASEPCVCGLLDIYTESTGQQVEVPAGATVTVHFNVEASSGWHDIRVTRDDSPRYLRRFAGHLESGKPSTSDPGPRKA
jgi:phospholipase C